MVRPAAMRAGIATAPPARLLAMIWYEKVKRVRA
jgi:hypothetical protein